MMTTLKEKDIVKEIIDHWGDYFPDLQFCKIEYSLRNFRVDMLASFDANLKDLGLRNEDYFCKPAVFIEVKYNSNMRDLIFELQKQIQFRDWYINIGKAFCVICVLSDDYDIDMVKFMEDNSIVMYKYSIEDDDISTLFIEEYNSKTFELEEIGDKYYESV